ncbi:30S ribosomal protein S17e [Candidatus Pacearchaeota archaeon]|nr:30S ribosomal protein S17e [Candidatus Pacearchaeota archaeon]
MGKIKTRLVKRTAENLAGQKDFEFNESFENNKKILGSNLPSKKIRNQVAGYLARLKRQEKEKEAEIEKAKKR